VKLSSGELTEKSEQTASRWLPGSGIANDDNHELQSGTPSTVPQKLFRAGKQLLHLGRAVVQHPAFIASLTVTGLICTSRQLRLLEPLELNAFDRMVQMRPALKPDSRLLVVQVTEADIQSYGFPLKDAIIHQLLTKLEQYQPAVIGLDIYRDIPHNPGNAELSAQLEKNQQIVPVCKISDADDPGTSPPSNVPVERVGFSDFAIDSRSVVRRALLFLDPPQGSRCQSASAFSFQLAWRYLKQKGIKAGYTPEEYMQIGDTVFKPLSPNDGGYQQADSAGYQILLNYRSEDKLAQSVTLTDVLQNRLDSSWVKDRVVLIGVTAPSLKDAFYTPYSTGQLRFERTPGVVVHGQIVSQILSSVLDGQPLFWYWPEWAEVLWIGGWTLAGAMLVRVVRHPGALVLSEAGALGALVGVSVILFFQAGWIPVVAPTLGLVFASTGVLGFNAYEAEQEKRKAEKERREIEQKAREQENNLALLQQLLRERLPQPSLPPSELDSGLSATAAWDTGMELEDETETAIATPTDFKPPNKVVISPPSQSPELLGGRYETKRSLGVGGFGKTYLAEDTQLPKIRQCVVKHLKPARRDEKFLQIARRLFETEAEILQKLGKHPQIPELYAYFEQNAEFYLVQEYVEGHPLTDELPVDKKLPESTVIEFLQEVLKILEFIHHHKVIHRDIKPSNIMRRESDQQIVLIDFGAVKQIQPQDQTDQENYTVAIGTRGYAPAEQYAGHPTFCSDIYALGMIGIQALTGIQTHQLNHSESGDIVWRHLASVSEEFAQILEKMVRYHFAARYQTVAEVLQDLEKIQA
jgi:CHASE2 domain-containing sensor protein/tRNA A-37 threonylcarbamoyl transferase component Bud32